MSAEAPTITKEPLIEFNQLGASLDRIERMMVPITEPVLRGVQYGDIKSRVRGQGMERDGVRDYEPGDDSRYIDWNLTARSADGVPKLRQHHKEITPNLWLVTDSAQSRHRITPGQAYPSQALQLSVLLSMQLLAQKEGMPSGLVAANDQDRFESQGAEFSRNNLLHLGHELVRLSHTELGEGAERQHLGGLLKRLGAVADGNLVIIVSDFRGQASPYDEQDGWARPLGQLKQQGNDIIAIEVTNPDDFSIERVVKPKLDSGVWHKGYGREARQIEVEYRRLAEQNQSEIDAALKSVRATHLKLSTDDSKWFTTLRAGLQKAARLASK